MRVDKQMSPPSESPEITRISKDLYGPLTLAASSIVASVLFWQHGEIDPQTPALLGLGLWILWRVEHGGFVRRFLSSIYTLGLTGILFDRSMPHSIYKDGQWIAVEWSWELVLCSLGCLCAGLLVLYHRRNDHLFTDQES